MTPRNEEQMPGCFSPFRSMFRRVAYLSRRQQPVDELQAQNISYSKGAAVIQERAVTEKKGIASGEPLPPYPSDSNADNPFLSAPVLETMEARVDEIDEDLRSLSLLLHEHPELMFKEKFAHDTLTTYMASQGFTVTPHYLGLETAWRASFKHGTGGPVLGVNSEMDALPGIGHACGHNLIAIAGVGIALGVKAALVKHDIAGEVVLLGTPAEEGGGGKVMLLDRGGYADMDACLMCHPSAGLDGYFEIPPSLAIQSLDVEFFGRTAHASGAPWEGINALDAAVLAYSSVSALRQQVKPECRIHGIIEGKNWAANVIPDYAKMNYIVRAPTGDEVAVLAKRIMACFVAAALATGCTHKITPNLPYKELCHNPTLSREYIKLATTRYGMVTAEPRKSPASTDFGDITQALPALHPAYFIPATSGNHTIGFTAAACSKEAHASTLRIVKTLAATGILLCSDKKFLLEVKESFQKRTEA
ncbi:amidohydrolase [Hysterangium stoloniferum]|nr:amidohydrolase [Hysterangium stoloniferum]